MTSYNLNIYETVAGSQGSDIITLTGYDTVIGFSGDDTIYGGYGYGNNTLEISGTSTDLNNAMDAQLTGVQTIVLSGQDTNLDLRKQSEGFNIDTRTHFHAIITSGPGADSITLSEYDTVIGFSGADTISGEYGNTLVLTGTSTDLNNADDAQLGGVYTIDASSAVSPMVINLSNQTEGFSIIGSSTVAMTLIGGMGDDSFTGSSGHDKLSGGAGNDTFTVFTGTDTIDGG